MQPSTDQRAPSRSPRQRARVACDRVARSIDEHYREPLDIHSLGELACWSEFHLQRSFVSCTGLTVGRYQRRRRIEAALALLVQTELSLRAVVREVGFGSAEVLLRAFVRETGVTPGRFRQATSAATLAQALPQWQRLAPVPPRQRFALRSRQREPQRLLWCQAQGMQARGYSQVGFATADRLLAEHRRLWPGREPGQMMSFYPQPGLGPSDPTGILVLALATPDGEPGFQVAPGFELGTLPGGAYVAIDANTPHDHAWQTWSRVCGSDLLSPMGLSARSDALAFESCETIVGKGGMRERHGVAIWLPVQRWRPAATPFASRSAAEASFLARLQPKPGQLFERIALQPR
jgi:AraC-like DNA-binding protein